MPGESVKHITSYVDEDGNKKTKTTRSSSSGDSNVIHYKVYRPDGKVVDGQTRITNNEFIINYTIDEYLGLF